MHENEPLSNFKFNRHSTHIERQTLKLILTTDRKEVHNGNHDRYHSWPSCFGCFKRAIRPLGQNPNSANKLKVIEITFSH